MERFLAAQNWLNELAGETQFFRKNSQPSLLVVDKILDALARPDKSFEWRVVVGGTAGKGTVCRRVEATLLAEGKSVATLCSPHVQVVTERIRINGKLISARSFGDAILAIRTVARKIGTKPTYYEAIVCAGILAAKNAGCEILICEVGMGGRADAVNAVRGKRIAAVTFIGNDHLEHFDKSLDKLAREKAGIFTSNCALCLSYDKKYCSVFDVIANQKIISVKGVWSGLNKKIARKICEKILYRNDFKMQNPALPCRWEKVASKIILDGAHSAPRFENILPKIKKIKGKKVGIFGLGKNHDLMSFKIILNQFEEVFWVKIPGVRDTWLPEVLREKLGRGVVCPDPLDALEKAKELGGTILVNGFFLGGAVRNLFYNPQKILEQQTEWPQ